MKVNLTSLSVKDQKHALAFYTEKLGFVKKEDQPMGEYRWITVTSPQGAEGIELFLEPLVFELVKDFQNALFDAGMPAASFETDDIESEAKRLKENGVDLRGEPDEMDGVKVVMFDDACGNSLCLVQKVT